MKICKMHKLRRWMNTPVWHHVTYSWPVLSYQLKSRPYPLTVCFDWAEPIRWSTIGEFGSHSQTPTNHSTRILVAVKNNGVAFQRSASAHGFGW